MKKLYLIEISDVYANQIRLPYSTGVVWSYCTKDKNITDNYELSDWFYYRQNPNLIIDAIKNPDVIGFSCWVWNWQITNHVAKKIKEKYPNCLIVFGGEMVPRNHKEMLDKFYKEKPYVDVIVHGEGELTFKDILLENLKENKDFTKVKGCSVKLENNKTFTTETRERIADINSMPSPYLDGTFDDIVKSNTDYKFEAVVESVRGCPYRCTFCEIGDLYFQKIKSQELDKIYEELDWLGKNKVEFFYDANPNFGLLFKRDLDLSQHLVGVNSKYGYPKKGMFVWAKGKPTQVLPIAEVLKSGELNKGVTVAVQTLNKESLLAIKRSNITEKNLQESLNLYEDKNVPTYLDFVMGLPKETLDTFKQGVTDLMEFGSHNYMAIYVLTALPNTPFRDPEYIDEYGIKLVETKRPFYHNSFMKDQTPETETIVVGTDTMTYEDGEMAYMYRWLFTFGHFLGHTQFISRFLRNHYQITYYEFYEKLMNYSIRNKKTLLGTEFIETYDAMIRSVEGFDYWGRVVPKVSDVTWDSDEATALTIMDNLEEFYDEIKDFLHDSLSEYIERDEDGVEIIEDVIEYQKVRLFKFNTEYPRKVTLNYNVYEVAEKGEVLKNTTHDLVAIDEKVTDRFDYATRIWWGRREGSYKVKEIGIMNER